MNGPSISLRVDRFDARGRGIADAIRADGMSFPVAVPWSIAGESVVAGRISKIRGEGFRHIAEDVSIVSPSPHRVLPQCAHFGLCGGCTWQHVMYEQQLRHKQQRILTLFPDCERFVKPIIGADPCYGYRNKMEFTFSEDRKNTQFFGLHGTYRNNRVFNLTMCPLTHPWMGQCVCAVRKWWKESSLPAYYPRSNEGTLQTLILREGMTSGDRMVMLTVSGNPDFAPKRHHLDGFVEILQREFMPPTGTLSVVLRIRQIAKGSPTQFYEMILAGPDFIREELVVEPRVGHEERLLFHISPQAFFQPNTLQAMKVYSAALQLADLQQNDVVWDLYCGIGTFGMLASSSVSEAIGIELSRESAYDAKTNSQRLQIPNFRILEGDVAARIVDTSTLPHPSVVIVDPPRAGLSPHCCESIHATAPRRLVYVSCNPESQARDVAWFVQRGWAIEALQAVDQFPQTYHVENIVLLTNRRQ